jgi:hypothetical protein
MGNTCVLVLQGWNRKKEEVISMVVAISESES